MSFNIYFDESHKIDKHTSYYAYYGILGWDESKTSELNKIACENKIFQELHFSKFKLDKIEKYMKLITYTLEYGKINIYVVNTHEAFKMIEKVGVSETLLRKGFYIKIPERLIYGMTRYIEGNENINICIDESTDYGSKFDDNITSVNIRKIVEDSEDKDECINVLNKEIQNSFQHINICKTIKDQLNSQALYRGLDYSVEKVKQEKSEKNKCLQVIDVILGCIVFLIEERYYEIKENVSIKEFESIFEREEFTEEETDFLYKCFKIDKDNEMYKYIVKQDNLEDTKRIRELNKRLKLYSENSIQKSEFIYKLLSQPQYLDKFSNFNIFLWGNEYIKDEYDGKGKDVSKFNISKYISKFLDFKYKFDNDKKIEIVKLYLAEGRELNYGEREYKNKLGYGSNLKRLIRRYITELEIN